MAVFPSHHFAAGRSSAATGKAATIALYVLMAVLAIAIGVPAAIATAG
jgi:hypothetical protein